MGYHTSFFTIMKRNTTILPPIDHADRRLGESSEVIQKRVEAARERQRLRFPKRSTEAKDGSDAPDPITCNAEMRPAEVRQYCVLDDTSRSLMKTAMSQLNLSARAYHRVLKLSRTIADLAGSESIQTAHLAEALQYRPRLMEAG